MMQNEVPALDICPVIAFGSPGTEWCTVSNDPGLQLERA